MKIEINYEPIDKPHIVKMNNEYTCIAFPGYSGCGTTPKDAWNALVATIGYQVFRAASFHLRDKKTGAFIRQNKTRFGFRPVRHIP